MKVNTFSLNICEFVHSSLISMSMVGAVSS